MNVVETIVVFAVIPLAIYGLAGLLTLRRRSAAPRYRSGQAWEYPAMWWSANPEGVGEGHRHAGAENAAENSAPEGAPTAVGGARGNW